MPAQGILKPPEARRRYGHNKRPTFAVDTCASEASMFGSPRQRPRQKLELTRPRAATPAYPELAGSAILKNGVKQCEKRFKAPLDWFIPDSFSEQEETHQQAGSSSSEPAEMMSLDQQHQGNACQEDLQQTIADSRPQAGQADGVEDEYDPANHPEDALNYRNLTEFITVIRDNYRNTKTREVLTDWEKIRRVSLREGDLLVDIRRDMKDVFRSKILVGGEGGRNVNVETRMDPKFEKVLVTSNTKDPETERRNREKERCLWLQEDRMRWIRALYEHIKEFRTQAKFYLALVIEARGRDPEYDPEDDEQVVAIRKQMIPWADEVMSNVLLLAGIETQIYADLQKEMPSVKL